jgi:hypothetical protein
VHEKLLAIHGFSREIEKEADEYGLTLFNKKFRLLTIGSMPKPTVPKQPCFSTFIGGLGQTSRFTQAGITTIAIRVR